MITAAVIIELALKSLLVAGGALVVLRLVRRRSAAQRSWIAHLGLVALIALPAAVLLMPGWNPLPATLSVAEPQVEYTNNVATLPTLATTDTLGETSIDPAPPGAEATAEPAPFVLPTAGELAVWAYALPAILLLLTMLVAVIRLGAMHRRANVLVDSSWLSALAQAQRRMGFKHGTALLVSAELRSPVSWGLMRPIILLSEDTVDSAGEAEAIIAHELAHVARFDWAKLLIARVACALFWFNPLVWKLAREAHQLREEAADDAVLLSEVDDATYATLLVNAARHDNRALLMAAHGVAPAKDSLKRRITRVLDRDQERTPAGNAWAMICVASLAAVAMPLAAFDPSLVSEEPAEAVDLDAVAGLEELPAGLAGDKSASSLAGLPVTVAPHEIAAAEDAHHSDEGDDEIDNLVAWKAVGMTPEYAAEIRAAGFAVADTDDLVGAKAVGVTPEFAREIRRWDSRATLEDVIGARAVGVTAQYYGEMRAILPNADLEEVVEMKALGVTAAYANEMRALFPRATGEEIAEMKAVGVTPAFVREMRQQGLSADEPDEAVEGRMFSQHGGKSGAVSTMAQAGAEVGMAVATSVTRNLPSMFTGPRPAPGPKALPGPRPIDTAD
jgi:beta-lactamase regulating signal transducer with metallopeptidase domain